MSLFSRIFKRRTTPPDHPHTITVIPVYRETSTLSVDEWRGQNTLVAAAQKVLAMPEVKQMIDTLRNSHPANYVYPENAPGEIRAVIHARGEGYTLCLSNLEALGKLQKPREELGPATFEDPFAPEPKKKDPENEQP